MYSITYFSSISSWVGTNYTHPIVLSILSRLCIKDICWRSSHVFNSFYKYKNFQSVKGSLCFVSTIVEVSKISLNVIENPGICRTCIANLHQRGWLPENQERPPIFQLKMADSANPYKPQNR